MKLATNKKMSGLPYAALICQMIFLVILNITYRNWMIDYDSSSGMLHAVEMWNQHSLFPTQYHYQTTLDLDSLAPLVAIFYGITKDIALAQAIVNCLSMVMFVYVFHKIFKHLAEDAWAEAITITLLLLPYTIGQLGYASMLFARASFYCVRVILPMLILSVLLDIKEKKKLWTYGLRLILGLVWCFFAGMSTGAYLLICGLAPFLLYEVLSWMLQKQEESRWQSLVYECACVFFLLCGYGYSKHIGFEQKAASMMLVTGAKYPSNIFACLTGIFELFGGLPSSDTAVMSLKGIAAVLCWSLVVLLLCAVIYWTIKVIKERKVEYVQGICLILCLVNLVVLTLTDSTYGGGNFENRYHLIPMMAVFVLFFLMLQEEKGRWDKVVVCRSKIVLSALVLGAMVLLDAKAIVSLKSESNMQMNVMLQQMADQIADDKNELCIFVSDDSDLDAARRMRMIAYPMDVIVVDASGTNVAGTLWGGTAKALDNTSHPEKTAVIVRSDLYEYMREYLRTPLSYVSTIGNYNIYEMPENRYDFVSGKSANLESTVDFPFTPGWQVMAGQINAEGSFVSDGSEGVVLRNDQVLVESELSQIDVSYQVKADDKNQAYLNITSPSGQQESIVLDGTKEAASISLSDLGLVPGAYVMEFYEDDGVTLEINKVVYR